VATRSTVPDEAERGDKLIESREPMIISLVLDVLICISLLLAVQVSTEVKYDCILLAEPVDGISSDSVVSSTNLCSSQAALRSSTRTINDRGPSRDPCDIPPQSVCDKCLKMPYDRYNLKHAKISIQQR